MRRHGLPTLTAPSRAASRLVIAPVLFALIAPLARADDPAVRIVAEVNGAPITQRELDQNLAIDEEWWRLVKNPRATISAADRRKHERRVLDKIIDELVLVQEAQNRGLALSPEEEREVVKRFDSQIVRTYWGSKEELEQYLTERGIPATLPIRRFRNSFLVRKVVQLELQRVDSFVAPQRITQYYERNLERYRTKSRVVFRHIRIRRLPGQEDKAKAKLDALLAELAPDAGNWNACCAKFSDGAKRKKGGRLEWASLRGGQREIREAIPELTIGEPRVIEVSPKPAAYGRPPRPGAYLVLMLEVYDEAGVKPIEDVEADVRKQLRDLRYQEVLEQLRARLRSRATVKDRFQDG